jgi:hypothetical protein
MLLLLNSIASTEVSIGMAAPSTAALLSSAAEYSHWGDGEAALRTLLRQITA